MSMMSHSGMSQMHNWSLLHEFSFLFIRFTTVLAPLIASFEGQFLFPCGQHGGVTYGEARLALLTLKSLWVSE